ncbi:hypothetical protein STEG23_033162 [Scotinomys teguina]
MILQRIFRLSSVLRSAVSVHLRRNIGVTAVAFNKELDPVQKLFVEKIREYKSKRQLWYVWIRERGQLGTKGSKRCNCRLVEVSDKSIPTYAIIQKQINITKESDPLGIQRRHLKLRNEKTVLERVETDLSVSG